MSDLFPDPNEDTHEWWKRKTKTRQREREKELKRWKQELKNRFPQVYDNRLQFIKWLETVEKDYAGEDWETKTAFETLRELLK